MLRYRVPLTYCFLNCGSVFLQHSSKSKSMAILYTIRSYYKLVIVIIKSSLVCDTVTAQPQVTGMVFCQPYISILEARTGNLAQSG